MSKVKIDATESSKSTVPASVSSNQSDNQTTLAERQHAFQDLESKASTMNKLMDVDVDINRMNQ